MRSRKLTHTLFYLVLVFGLLAPISVLAHGHEETDRPKHTCVHKEIPIKVQEETEDEIQHNLRQLQTITWQPIRITFSDNQLEQLPASYLYMRSFIQAQMRTAVKFFNDHLLVIPNPQATLVLNDTTCGEETIAQQFKSPGVNSSDLHIFVRFVDEPSSSFLAYAGACLVGGSDIQGRVIAGRVVYNLHYLKVDSSVFQSARFFEDNLETTLHEIVHILGFSGGMIQYWWNPVTKSRYMNQTSLILETRTIRNLNTTILKSPKVAQFTREYFNCSTITGMQLENQGESGSIGSHWEKTILFDEFMNPQAISSDSVISKFTFALLEDTNWFKIVNYSAFEPMSWGKNKGCDFYEKACFSTINQYPEFPSPTQNLSCGFNRHGLSYRGQNSFVDGCPVSQMYSNRYCMDPANVNLNNDQITLSSYEDHSYCYPSNITQSGYTFSQEFRCFRSECVFNTTGNFWSLKIEFGNNTQQLAWFLSSQDVASQPQRQSVSFSANGKNFSGFVEAPPSITQFCQASKTCTHSCSSNGYCLNGACICNKNYHGDSCQLFCEGVVAHNATSGALSCLNSCPSGTYLAGNICQPCFPGCLSCYGPAFDSCLTCAPDFSLTQGKCCAQGCESCEPEYQNVTLTSYTQLKCQSCSAGYFSFLNSTSGSVRCLSTCPQGWYGDLSARVCRTCPTNCLSCLSATTCTQCPTGLILLSTGECSQGCTAQQWRYEGGLQLYNVVSKTFQRYSAIFDYLGLGNQTQCVDCAILNGGCRTCNVTHCIDCQPGLLLFQGANVSLNPYAPSSPSFSRCVQQCPDAHYANTTSLRCERCPTSCLTCVSAFECRTCPSGHFLHNGQCFTSAQCPVGTFADAAQARCVPCAPSCTSCSSATTCTSCISGFSLNSSTCVQLCPAGTYKLNLTCAKCHYLCATCFGGEYSQCLTCPAGAFNFQGECVQTCPDGYFTDSASSACKACPAPALSCLSSTSLLSCRSGYFLLNNNCLQECPSGYYADFATSSCRVCHTSCLVCSGPSDFNCQACVPGLFLDPTTQRCVRDCPVGTFKNQSTPSYPICTPCSLTSLGACESCANATSCQLCMQGSFWSAQESRCAEKCPPGRYPNFQTRQCEPCHFTCGDSCFGPDSKHCLTCSPTQLTYLMPQAGCVLKCPDGLYGDNSTQTCQPCHAACATCFGPTKETCNSCRFSTDFSSSYYLFNQSCLQVQEIPEGFYLNRTLGRILPCNSGCSLCLAWTGACLKCNTGLLLDSVSQQCVDSCRPGYFSEWRVFQPNCVPCDTKQCLECEESATNCTRCFSGRYRLENPWDSNIQCTNECPEGYFPLNITLPTPINGITYEGVCEVCSSNCLRCQRSPENCVSCLSGMILQGNRCVQNCSSGTYQDASLQRCLPCSAGCSVCTSATNCAVCQFGWGVLNTSTGSVCTNTCPVGQFMDSNQGACRPCPAGCQNCLDQLTCSKCASGTSRYFDPFTGLETCVQQCPRGFYSNVNYRAAGEELECKRCSSICKDCQGFGHNCTVCGRYAVDIVNVTRNIDFSWMPILEEFLDNFRSPAYSQPMVPSYYFTKDNFPQVLIFQEMNEVISKLISSFRSFAELNSIYNLSLNMTAFNSVAVNATFLENDISIRYGSNFSQKAQQLIQVTRNYSAIARFVQYLKQTNGTFLDQYIQLDKVTSNLTEQLFFGAFQYPEVVERMFGFYFKNMPKAFLLSQLTRPKCDWGCPSKQYYNSKIWYDYEFWYLYDQSFDPYSPQFSQDLKFATCQQCDSTCDQCSTKANYCVRCNSGKRITFYPYYGSENQSLTQEEYINIMKSECLTTCPKGFYTFHGWGDWQFINNLSLSLDLYHTQVAQSIGYEQLNKSKLDFWCNSGLDYNLQYEMDSYDRWCNQNYSGPIYGDQIPYNCSEPFPFQDLNISDKETFLSVPSYYRSYLPRFINCYRITYNNPSCEACMRFCDVCTDREHCQQCQSGYYLANVTRWGYFWNQTTQQHDEVPFIELNCVKECPADQFLNLMTKQCQTCPSLCSEGCYDEQNCKGCFEGLTPLAWFDPRCNSSNLCTEGQYLNETDQTCGDCPFNCLRCQSSESCDICLPRYHPDSFTGDCLDCGPSCEECLNFDTCLRCSDYYYLNASGQCTNQCGPQQYVGLNQTSMIFSCQSCPSECQSCVSATNCSACSPGWYILQHTCYTDCPIGYGAHPNGYCQMCDQGCDQCTYNSTTSCTLCKEGLFLDQASGSCVNQCPVEHFQNYENRTCDRCPSGCKNCSSEYQCHQCQTPMTLLFGQCVSSCPSGFYQNVSSSYCEFCHPDCKECQGPMGSDCISCFENYIFFQNQCVSFCPSGQFASINGTCDLCAQECGECMNATGCLTCNQNFFMHQGQCVAACPSSFYADSLSGYCMPCIENCDACLTFYNCTTCSAGYVYDNHICKLNSTTGFYLGSLFVEVCPSGYFGNTTSQKCELCGSGCATCSSSLQCLTCAPGFNLLNSTCGCGNSTFYFSDKCVTQCPPGHFASLATRTCEKCSERCLSCMNSSQTCTQCSPNYLQLWNTSSNSLVCTTQCPVSFVADLTTMKCRNCHASCQSCSGLDFDDCLSCKSGFALFLQSQCVLQCPLGYFNKSGICESCDSTCENCLQLNSTHTNCAFCKEGFFKINTTVGPACAPSCENGYYPHKLSRTCQPCGFNCSTCFDRLQDSCLSCPTDFVLYRGRCLTTCPPGFFKSLSTKTCEPCTAPCLTCDSSATSCTSCVSGFFHDNNASTCTTTCPEGYYADAILRACTDCDLACETCQGPYKDQCLTCSANNFLFQSYCSPDCPPGYYPDTATRSCTACPSSCVLCSGPESCSVCAANYFKNSAAGSTCVQSCQANQYKDTSRQVCAECHATCATCKGPNAWECLTCSIGLFYLPSQSVCVQDCPTPMTVADATSKTCKPCPGDCQTCSADGTQCLSCKTGFFHNSQCLAACPSGFFGDLLTRQCKACHFSCASCQGPSQSNCITCSNSSAILMNSQCLLECPTGFMRSQNTCVACSNTCRTCSNDVTSCTSCFSPRVLSGSECLSQCPVGFYSERYLEVSTYLQRCARCDSRCASCTGAGPKACLTCTAGFVLSGSECVANCSSGQYMSGSECKACANGCETCLDATYCLSCPTGKFLLPDNTCGSECLVGFFSTSTSNVCTRCPLGCNNCTNLTACHSCAATMILFNGRCLQSCPTQYFSSGSTCEQCHPTCTKCSGTTSSSCLSCQPGLFYLESSKSCQATCPAGFFASTTSVSCQQCPRECATCSSPALCQTCAPGFFLFDTKCVSACPDGFFGDQATGRCVVCNQKCERCFGALDSQCTSCRQGFVFHRETCGLTCPAGFFSDFSQRRCAPCSERCSACSQTADFCTACRTGFFLNELQFRCVLQSECPPGFFANAPNNLCATCPATCESCSSNSTCFACKPGFFLQPELGECTTGCPSGTFHNNQTRQCVRCAATAGCQTCTSLDVCLTCSPGFFLNATSGRCLQACAPGTFGDLTTQTCRACHAKCKTCFGPNEDECTSCSAGFFHQKEYNLCAQTCPEGFFPQNTTSSCQRCVAPCQTCATNTSCLSCLDGTFYHATQRVCLALCPAGTYADAIQRKCLPCDASCATCTQPFNDFCQSCNTGFFHAFGTACLSSCPTGFYPNSTRRECQPCDPRCSSCSSATSCQSCSTGFYLLNSTCVTNCTNGTYSDVYSATCKVCNSLCANCSGPSRQECLSCKPGTFYHQRQCLTACPAGFFADSATSRCVQCSSTCRTCSSSTACLSCGSGLFLEGTQCLATCPAGKYGDKQLLQCLTCHLSCETCTDGTDLGCLNCAQSYFKSSTGKCGLTCPPGSFPDLTQRQCLPCSGYIKNCQQCQSSTTCTACASGYELAGSQCGCPQGLFILDGVCITSCPEGYFANAAARRCEPCQAPCKACLSATTCLSCTGGLFLQNNSCVQQCPSGFYGDSLQLACVQCDAQRCLTCTSQYQCQSCKDGFFLYEQTCLQQCKLGFYGDSAARACVQCKAPCQSCLATNSGSFCLSCTNSSLSLHEGQCLNVCPSGYFRDAATQRCAKCQGNCLTCTSATTCLTCPTGLFFENSQCAPTCSAGFYGEATTSLCQPCHASCAKCSGPSSSQCQECKASFFLTGEQLCSTTCPSGTFADATTRKCQSCANNCQTCTDATTCTSCKTGLVLSAANTCGCTAPCRTCSVSPTNCTSCIATKFLSENSCVDDCPVQFTKDFANGRCVRCSPQCNECSGQGPDKCTNCATGFISWGSLCFKEVPTCQPGQYPFYNTATSAWTCESCPAKCRECHWLSTGAVCKSCAVGFFQDPTKNNDCIQIPGAPAGEYFYFSPRDKSPVKAPCPRGCSECAARDFFDPNSVQCSSCATNFTIINGTICVLQPSQSCPDGQFRVLIPGSSQFSCSACPSGCLTCRLENESDHRSAFQCLSCSVGYALESNICKITCLQGQFFNPTSNTCQSCDISCSFCTGGSASQCTRCSTGYKLNTATSLCEKETIIEAKDCGLQAYEKDSVCYCFDKTLFFIDGKCVSGNVENNCPTGSYLDSSSSLCVECKSNNDEALCEFCDGPQFSDCKGCKEGYFLDRSDFSCVPCSDDCLRCSSGTVCNECAEGTYQFKFADGSIKCSESCPSGTLPSIASLYYLNKQLFTETEIVTAFIAGSSTPTVPSLSDMSFAIGIKGESVYTASAIPWTSIQGKSYYRDTLIRLECLACQYGCAECYTGQLLLQDTKECRYLEKCPLGYTLSAPGTCSVLTSDISVAITVSTLNADGVQPQDKNLNLQVNPSSNFRRPVYSWQITDVASASSSSTEINFNTKMEIIQELLQGVNTAGRKLSIPKANLLSDLIVTFEVTVKNDTHTRTDTESVTIRNIYQVLSLDILKVSQDLLTVSPTTGVSGTTEFQAQYVFDNVKAFRRGNWRFSITIGRENPIPFVSTDMNNVVKFIVQPHNSNTDEITEIIFEASRGKERYQSIRRISTSKFVKPANLAELPAMQQLSEPTSDLSLLDIAKSANILVGLKDLTGADAEDVKSLTRQVTQKMGEILNSTIGSTSAQIPDVDTVVNSVKQLTSVVSDDAGSLKDMINILGKVAGSTQTSQTLETLIESVSELQKKSGLLNQTQEVQQEIQQKAQEALKQAIVSQAQQLNEGNYETKFSLDGGNIQGVSKFVDLESGEKAAVNIGGFEQQFSDEMFQGNKDVSFVAMSQPRSSLSSISGASDLKSDSLLELTAVSASQGEIKNSNLSNKCAVQLSFEVDYIDKAATKKDYSCMHYDEAAQKFVSNQGCEVKSTTEPDSNNKVILTCCCNHNTLFGAGSTGAIKTRTVIKYSSASYLTASVLLLISILSILF